MNFQNFQKEIGKLVLAHNPSQSALKVETLFKSKTIFEHNAKQKMYPASLVKLFWAVLVVQQIANPQTEGLLKSMMEDSSDEAGQRIVDLVCKDYQFEKFEERFERRKNNLNQPWINEGFQDLNITHKTFLDDYDEFDGRIKSDISENFLTCDGMNLFWRKLLTNSFESFSLKESQQKQLLSYLRRTPLEKELEPEIKHFQSTLLGYKIPSTIQFFSKAGWRDKTINDSAVIQINEDEYLIATILTELGETEGIIFMRELSKIISKLIA